MTAYQASLSTRYRTNYREIIEQFLTINFPSSTIGSTTIFPPYSSQAFTVEGPNMRLADQWQQPSSSSSVFDTLGQEWTIFPPDQQTQGLAPSIPPAKNKTQTPTRKRKSVDQIADRACKLTRDLLGHL